MKVTNTKLKKLATYSLFAVSMLTASKGAFAHCDTMEGPVIKTAQAALDKGDVTPLLKWIQTDEEKGIQEAFQKTLNMRANGPEAREFADMYFFETLVRIHRAGEGAPYTGLKPGVAIDPAVALADKALENGSVDKLVTVLSNAMANGIRERFEHVYEKQKIADNSVAAGRDFVGSYVEFTHYIEGLHGLIKGGSGHHGEEATAENKHDH